MISSFTVARAGIVALGLMLGLATPMVAAVPQDAPDAERPRSDADLPKAKKVIEDAIKAMGGRKKFEDVKSMLVNVDISTAQGSMKMEVYTARGGKFLRKQEMMGQEMRIGSDGKVGWYHAPMMGYDLIADEELPEARRQTEMHTMILRLEEDFKIIETVDRAEFAGKPCYKLRMVPEKPKTGDDEEDADGNGDEGEQFFYFDIENKLLQGLEATHELPFGQVTISVRFDEWKEFGDLKLFTRMRVNQMGQETTLNWTKLEIDTVPDEVFELPEEVKKLALQRLMEEEPAPDAPAPADEPGAGN